MTGSAWEVPESVEDVARAWERGFEGSDWKTETLFIFCLDKPRLLCEAGHVA